MTWYRIIRELWKTKRWGINYQPDLLDFAGFLVHVDEEVGLEKVKVIDRNHVYLRTRKPLTPQLAFELGWMIADGLPESIENDQIEFNLRWK